MKSTNISLICSDIDGTLLNIDRELSPLTKKVIHRLDKSIPFILISSRMPVSMRQLQKELNCLEAPLIAYNGSLVVDQATPLLSREIDVAVIEEIVTAVKSTNIHVSLYYFDQWYVPANDYWAQREAHNTRVQPKIQPLLNTLNEFKQRKVGAHKVMCMGPKEEIEGLERLLTTHFQTAVNAYRSKDTYIEVNHKAQDKFSALRFLMKIKYPSLKLENTLAFGDNYNDKTLLEQVGHGVAVANAKEEIISIAQAVTSSNIDDGVARYIQGVFPTN